MKVKRRLKKLNRSTIIVVTCIGIVLIVIGCFLKSIESRNKQNNEDNEEEDLGVVEKYTADGYKRDDEINTTIWLEDVIPEKIKQYDTAEEVLEAMKEASGSERQFYLKHKVKDKKVAESYIEFIISDEAAKESTGLTAGTYAIRGGKASYYNSNKEIMDNAFGESNCSMYKKDYYYCSGDGLDVYNFVRGYIGVFDGEWYCDIQSNGSSACEAGAFQG